MKKSLLSLLLLTGALSVSTLASCGETSSSVSSTGNTTSSSTSSSSSSSSSSTSVDADAISEGTWDADAKVATGTYQYSSWGNKYGVKVSLTIDTETNIITKASFEDSSEGAHNMTPSDVWKDHEQQHADYEALAGNLAAYTNLNVWVAKGLTEGITENSSKDSFLQIVAGATQTNGRFAKAVNLAVTSYIETAKVTTFGTIGIDSNYIPENTEGLTQYSGEVSYEEWKNTYASKVTIYVDAESKIQYAKIEEPAGSHNLTPSWNGNHGTDYVPTAEQKAETAVAYYNSGKTLTDVLKGQSVTAIKEALAAVPTTAASGSEVEGVGEALNSSYKIVTAATQTNGRNVIALKNAVEQAVIAAK